MTDSHSHEDRNRIQAMFDAIAFRYDCINRWLSLRRDVAWRKALVAALPCSTRLRILDLATGTADVLLAMLAEPANESFIVGADISQAMLKGARKKIERAGKGGSSALAVAAAESLCFPPNVFDIVTVAFGVRNFSDRAVGLAEIYRVLRPGGRLLILEFSLPKNALIRALYLVYFRSVLPRLAGWFSRQTDAYRYLNQSVEAFPDNETFRGMLKETGFQRVALQPLTFGIATLYIAYKTH